MTIDADVLAERSRLMGLAYRMLGTVAEAEDAVQETYIRWYRLSQPERDAVDVPRAWLRRVAGRVCLDVLGSARWRRERYPGQWLPEPVPADAFAGPDDPLQRVALDDSVSTALLLVLESTTPAERVAFVLHDVFAVPYAEIAEILGRTPDACRRLAATARRRVRDSRPRSVPRSLHDDVVRAFAAACRDGDLSGLVAVLDPDVELRSDGGGVVTSAPNPVRGPDRVGRFLLGVLRRRRGVELLVRETPGGLGIVLRHRDQVVGVLTLHVVDGAVAEVWLVVNPDKLALWN
jgi:RNA polymerase sigma-70 factor (ECF subfamily)